MSSAPSAAGHHFRCTRSEKENTLRPGRSTVDLEYMFCHWPRLTCVFLGWGAVVLVGSVSGCVEAVPQDVVHAIEDIDRDLMELRADELFPHEYAHFSQQWAVLKTQAQAEEDVIRWTWEPNNLEVALRQLQEEGVRTVARLTTERESIRRSAEEKIAQVENRPQTMSLPVSVVDNRFPSRQKPEESELLIHQAHAHSEQGQYDRSLDASERAAQSLARE